MAIKKESKITSKGQITVPKEVRRILGVRTGDKLIFESDANGVHVRALRGQNRLEKYRGIGTPGVGSGRKAINRWLREMRGE
jgi:AbrB family looped-hinge helix DNA binding protein